MVNKKQLEKLEETKKLVVLYIEMMDMVRQVRIIRVHSKKLLDLSQKNYIQKVLE